jgi:rRNA maturation endonuclease Nob1
MFGNETAIVEEIRDEKAEKMIEYVKSLKAIEDAIEPYAEQKRELKKDFKDQGWLTGDEISMTVKAYRMMKKDVDIDQFVSIFESLSSAARGGS